MMKIRLFVAMAIASISVSAVAQLRINAQLLADPKTLTLAQLSGITLSGNFQNVGGGTFLSININNDSDEPKMATLTATLLYNGQELGSGRTRNRARLAPRAAARLTNNNLISGEWAMTSRTENNAMVQNLMKKAGGKLPDGTYMLTLTIETDDGGFASFPISFTVAGNQEKETVAD